MRGSIQKVKLPSGTVVWRVQLDAGRDETGKRIMISRNFKRKGEAEDALDEMKRQQQDGLLVRASPKTVREFLEEWLVNHVERNCSPKTSERYNQLVSYAADAFGDVALKGISPLMLERFYARVQAKGKAGNPLSARTVKHIHDTLRAAFNTAIRWKLLRSNPAVACQLPKPERKEARVIEDAQLEFLIDAARGHPWLYALLVLAAATGMRRGELLALAWSDVDLDYNSLTVSKSLEQTKAGLRVKRPKNGKTRRLPLPLSAIEVLKEHRRAQQGFRESFGSDYRADLDLIFCTPEGEHLKPNTVSPAVCLLAEKCGLKGIGLHSLRHTHGSQLLAAGVPLPTVSKRLGHSNVAVTAAIYAHSFAADEIAAAEAWEAKLGDAIRNPSQIRQ